MARQTTKFVKGSDNVFADIGLPDADEHFLKARLVTRIADTKTERGLTQVQLARLLGIGQPDVSKLLAGEFGKYSVERLIRFLRALDYDVSIVVRSKRARKPALTISVP